jgi:hypothetical protein
MRVPQFIFASKDAWLPLESAQLRCRPAQGARDVDQISGPSARAQESFFLRDTSQQNDIGNHRRLFGHISASQRHSKVLRQSHESVEEAIHPFTGQFGRQGQR